MNRFLVGSLIIAMVAGTLAGCSSGARKGGAIGAAVGGLVGGVVGNRGGDTAKGVIVGAVVGGAAGAIIGDYMDKQAEEMEQVEGATVERVGEGINITFESGILFAVDKSDLNAEAQANLVKMAEVLNKYPDTNLVIEGHTDATGSDSYNQTLSERRANAVQVFLVRNNVSPSRMTSIGYGESQPVADNAAEDGRRQNRRVEVAIIANEELKARAEAEAAKG